MSKKFNLYILIIFTLSLLPIGNNIFAEENLGEKLSGRILLQVEENGEAWYVNPGNSNKYYLGSPKEAFDIMSNLGLGISNKDLKKIPIGLSDLNGEDNDQDGLPNNLEIAIKTNLNNSDTDQDGYEDREEILNNYNPLGEGENQTNKTLINANLGKIFLQVENLGQAWYLNPNDGKRYFLDNPKTAFDIMRMFGLGISNKDLEQIPTSVDNQNISNLNNNKIQNNQQNTNNTNNIMLLASSAIQSANEEEINKYFTPKAVAMVKYSLTFLDSEGKKNLANIVANANLSSQNDNEKIYTSYVEFQGEIEPVEFHVIEQDDGSWKLANI